MNKRTMVFAVAVVLQVAVLLSLPAKKLYTRATGKDVVLKVVPVDPYNILSGYYVTLSYDISRPTNFPNVPKFEPGEAIYAIIEQQADSLWQPVSIERELPRNLPVNRVAVRGHWNEQRINYGIEEFFIPEGKRETIADDLNKNINEARVEVKVDAQGNAALLRLRIQDRIYE